MSQTSGTEGEQENVFNLADLNRLNLSDLRSFAQDAGLTGVSSLRKQELIFRLLQAQAEREGNIFGYGVLELVEDGYGFLRQERFLPGPNDVYVSASQIRRFGLRTGDEVTGQVRPPKEAERYFGLLRVEAVNGVDPDTARMRPHFDELVPTYPTEAFRLETTDETLSGRLIDLLAPIGKGQRGLIVAPPESGKTTLLQQIAAGIAANSPSTHILALLVADRPEDVTEMQRAVRGEVLYSTFDERAEDHIHIAEVAHERARRLLETGRDVVLLLDSLTRLTLAYNTVVPATARGAATGLEPAALYAPKRLFAAARNVERGGSLTVIATCHVSTGSRLDDLICSQFRGTATMELTLDRALSERRVFPPIDIPRSGTWRDELLLDESVLSKVRTMRQMVDAVGGAEGTELLLTRVATFPDNERFLQSLNKGVA